MRLGLAAYEYKNKDIAFNISQIEKAIHQAKTKSVDLLCFGEAFLQGFASLTWNYDEDQHMAVEASSKIMQEVKQLSQTYHIDMMLGYIEKDGDMLYSSYALIEDGDITYNFRRISKNWREVEACDEHYGEGDVVTTFTYQGNSFLVGLCGDVWIYPQQFKTDAIFIWPVFVTFPLEQWQIEKVEYGLHAKQIANSVVLINSICHDQDCIAHGGAFFYKEGRIEASLDFDVEDVLVVDM